MLKIKNLTTENVKPEITSQITLIEGILSNLNISAETSEGSNKNKLQINNTNLQKISDKEVIEDAIILPYLNTTY